MKMNDQGEKKNNDKGERGELQEGYLGVCEGLKP